MDKKQQDPQLDQGIAGMAPQGISDTQATESDQLDPLAGNGDRTSILGNGDRDP